jgi:hypothetical protein
MGYGDCLIATGIAKKAKQKHPGKPICIGDGNSVEWSEVYENLGYSREVVPGCIWVHSHKSFRPYVDIASTTKDKFVWKRDFRVSPGEIVFSPEELHWEQTGFAYIEPNIKGWLGPNKDWGFDNWQELVLLFPAVRWVQGPGRKLNNVEQVETRSFRDACALLSRADFFVGTDGGLHHAAAALGKPAVVVWGGFTSPQTLGYDTHENVHAGGNGCGTVGPCAHCAEAMKKIPVSRVVKAIGRVLGRLGADPDKGKAEAVSECC